MRLKHPAPRHRRKNAFLALYLSLRRGKCSRRVKRLYFGRDGAQWGSGGQSKRRSVTGMDCTRGPAPHSSPSPMIRPTCFALLCLALGFSARAEGPFQPPRVDVFFSPDGGCTEACVSVLKGAKKSIYVQAYSFTSAPIARGSDFATPLLSRKI